MLHKPWWCLHSCVDIKSRVRQHSLLSQKEDDWIQNLEIIQWHLVVMMLCLDERCWTSAKLYCSCKIWLDQIVQQHPWVRGSNKKSTKKLPRQSAPRIIEKFHISVKRQNDFLTFSVLDTDTDTLNAVICGFSIYWMSVSFYYSLPSQKIIKALQTGPWWYYLAKPREDNLKIRQ